MHHINLIQSQEAYQGRWTRLKPKAPVYTDCLNCGTANHRDYDCPCSCHEETPQASLEYNRFDIVEAHYWFANDYHDGQMSPLYARLCRITSTLKTLKFAPSPLASGPSTENAQKIYEQLQRKASSVKKRQK